MQFHEYAPIMTSLRRMSRHFDMPTPESAKCMYEALSANPNAPDPQNSDTSAVAMMHIHYRFDTDWDADRKPYYTVYPTLSDMLTRLSLEKITGDMIRLPHGLKSLSVRFPVGNELGGEVRTIWMNSLTINRNVGEDDPVPGLSIGIDHGEIDTFPENKQEGLPVYLIRCFPLDERTIEESLNALPLSWTASQGKYLDPDIIRSVVRLACTLCLLGDDPEILKPEILNKDAAKANPENIERLQQKAAKRGKLGWSVGRDLEVVPHYRRPHPALVWTGKGKAIPKIILRSGSIVHREIVGRVPTGYGEEDGNRTEQVPV
jgi:hypothetical protein